ncbi:sugar transferase [Frigidibacter sp. MR17.24]|uniref:sugar transferase n=1 Tax=Frigidibacter sp. MR17.24 TaxID=3127345 RepID=UPI003012CC51
MQLTPVQLSGARRGYAGDDPAPREGFYATTGKRLFDIAFAAVMLVLLAPTMLLLMALAALDGAAPLFRHKRIGRHGEVFGCLKIRSMVADADLRLARVLAEDPVAAAEWACAHKLSDDPRITRFGRFIRQTSLDELPQLWNVLRGEMSIVGPRPIVRDEMVRYGASIGAYLQMRPGLTGPWQASGRNDMSYDERVALDVDYARSLGFVQDLKIILRTAGAVVRRTGK